MRNKRHHEVNDFEVITFELEANKNERKKKVVDSIY